MRPNNAETWQHNFEIFKNFVTTHGFPLVGQTVDEFKIGQWYYNQISLSKRGLLSDDRKAALYAFNPLWDSPRTERQPERVRLVLSSEAWKERIGAEDIPIDSVLSDETLYICLNHGIYTCREYLTLCESFLEKQKLAYDHESYRTPLWQAHIFLLKNRKAVFETQFPKLEFTFFNIYIDCYGRNNSDLFKEDELKALGRLPTYFEAATALSKHALFQTREDFIHFLFDSPSSTPRDKQVLAYRFFDGLTLQEIGDKFGVTRERGRQMVKQAIVRLYQPKACRQRWIMHPRDRVAQQLRTAAAAAHAETPIRFLSISVRAYNCLRKAKLYTLGAVAALTKEELQNIPNLGRKTAEEIIFMLKAHGLSLSPSLPTVQNCYAERRESKATLAQTQSVHSSLESQISAARERTSPHVFDDHKVPDGPGGR